MRSTPNRSTSGRRLFVETIGDLEREVVVGRCGGAGIVDGDRDDGRGVEDVVDCSLAAADTIDKSGRQERSQHVVDVAFLVDDRLLLRFELSSDTFELPPEVAELVSAEIFDLGVEVALGDSGGRSHERVDGLGERASQEARREWRSMEGGGRARSMNRPISDLIAVSVSDRSISTTTVQLTPSTFAGLDAASVLVPR